MSVLRPVPLGAFDVLEVLGRGGMGEVWRAQHRASGLPVALKTMTLERVRTPRHQEQFAREVRAVARMSHRGIVHIHDHGVVTDAAQKLSRGRLVAGSSYLVMELATGGTLATHPPRSYPALRNALLAILDALAHAHARGVVHRDLKPENVLLAGPSDPRPGLKLADFGAVHMLGQERRSEGPAMAIGTPLYMAPEQVMAREHAISPATDLYALGCMTWWMTTGRFPFPGEDVRTIFRSHLQDQPPEFSPTIPVPRGFLGWLRRLLRKDPTDRFATAAHARLGLSTLPLPETAGDADGLVWARPEGESSTLDLFPVPTQTEPGVTKPRLAIQPTLPVPPSWRVPSPPAPLPLAGAGLALFGLRPLPLVGRSALQDRLWAELNWVAEDRATSVLLLSGAPGTGKSSLVRWLSERSGELGVAQTLVTRADPAQGTGPRFAPTVRRALGAGPSASQVFVAAGAHLERHGVVDEEEHLRLVELALPGALASLGYTTPRQTQSTRFAVLGRFLERIARVRPVLLWLDDLHWSPDGLAFLEWLLHRRLAASAPLLVVGTLRDGDSDRHRGVDGRVARLRSAGAVSIPVPPISQSALRSLVTRQLHLSGTLADQIVQRCEGTPLFAVHLVADWVARGDLTPGDDGFALTPGVEPRVPDTIHGLFQRPVHSALVGLPPDARLELEVASALGNPADASEVEAVVVHLGATGRGALERLARRGLMRRGAQGWEFAHGLLAESVARDAIAAGTWSRVQRGCADTLTVLEAGPARIAHHLIEAGAWADALLPLRESAVRDLDRSAYREALLTLDRHDELADRVALAPGDRHRIEAELWRQRVLWRSPALADSWPRLVGLEPAIRAASDPELLARYFVVRGRSALKLVWLADADEASRAVPPHPLPSVQDEFDRRILHADLAYRQGRLSESLAKHRATLVWARQIGIPRFTGSMLGYVSDTLVSLGALEEAEAVATEALGLARSVKNPVARGTAQLGLATIASARGDGQAAVTHFRRAHQAYTAGGHEAEGLVLLALAAAFVGIEDWSGATEAAASCVTEFTAREMHARVAVAHTVLAAAAAGASRWEACAAALTEAHDAFGRCTDAQDMGAGPLEVLIGLAEAAERTDILRATLELGVLHFRRRGQDDKADQLSLRLDTLDEEA